MGRPAKNSKTGLSGFYDFRIERYKIKIECIKNLFRLLKWLFSTPIIQKSYNFEFSLLPFWVGPPIYIYYSRFVNGLAMWIEPGHQLTDFTIFVFTVSLITPMLILSLLFLTRLVEYIDSTRFLLSTNASTGKSKLFTFNNSFDRALCWIASSNPLHRLRASAPKVDLVWMPC